jgi:hypothetical protein
MAVGGMGMICTANYVVRGAAGSDRVAGAGRRGQGGGGREVGAGRWGQGGGAREPTM